MQTRRYRSTRVASLRWGPSSLPLKGSWPAKFSIPSFVSAIHFDAVVVKLYFAESLTNSANGAQIWWKRGDLNRSGSHQINYELAMCLKTYRVIADLGAGAENATRQVLNIFHMKMLVVEVVSVEIDSKTLKEAVSDAMGDWDANLATTHFLIGSIINSHSFIYVVSRMGSTGSSVQGFVNSEFPDIIARICKHAFIPLAVGFGVATQVHFDAVVEAGAHGVVVGSGIVYLIKEAPAGQVPQVVENFCRGLKGSSPSNSSTAGVQSSQYHYPVVAAISRPTGMRLLLPRFGQYVPEALFDCLIELEEAHNATQNDPMF
ncbi:hypothetical protein M404DRAFT_20541 [Pisolithus tinctorius Marx 270]|uniref:tryptophan synthase n=1 Tax=Pisolithus tinctorius Marx 270 TaxID=870435 RepID=A0A0C3KN39_PISTI|nr:hypothetical protein M404DRAFT_20541 [Pisolithus tinctorius Marx 270]